MKQLTLQEIQAQSLEILQTVHDFCLANDIRYSLAYGTLIGAIRHKGFIPWDDDIDIIIPRPDFDRFCRTFRAPGLGLLWEEDKNYYLSFCRVFDTEKTWCRSLLPVGKDYKGGVWIDVFPADGVSDNFDEFSANIRQYKRTWMLQMRYRYARIPVKDIVRTCGFKDRCILLAIKASLQGKRKLERINADMRDNARRIPYGETEHWSQLCVLDDGVRNYQLCSDFEDTVDVPFEERTFKAMKGYDRFLRNVYGDYMQLPPEEQRQPKLGHTALYWKGNDK